MDGTQVLFKKIRGRDRSSFEALLENYGWKLYSHIRQHTKDRGEADRIFSEAFSCFYDRLEGYEGEDPIEALLFSCADQAAGRKKELPAEKQPLGPWALGQESGFSLPPVDPSVYGEKQEPLWLKIFYGICIAVLIFGILAAVWVMAWMLMSMNLIPELDLGYSWFNENIAHLF